MKYIIVDAAGIILRSGHAEDMEHVRLQAHEGEIAYVAENCDGLIFDDRLKVINHTLTLIEGAPEDTQFAGTVLYTT